MKDPYEVLGVGRDAPLEDVKKAYRELARKYHPDNYVGNELADLAQEKMKDINEAYDAIVKQREGGGDGAGGYGGYGAGGLPRFADIRQALVNGNLSLAQSLLEGMDERGAEWHFLYGALMYRKGWFDEAARHTRQAADMEPDNREYQSAAAQMRRGGGYRQTPGGAGAGGCNTCDCCTAMICADCLCRGC